MSFENTKTNSLNNDATYKNRVAGLKKIGCGANMNFDILPPVPNIKEKLMAMYEVTSMEQIIYLLKEQNKDSSSASAWKNAEDKVQSELDGFTL